MICTKKKPEFTDKFIAEEIAICEALAEIESLNEEIQQLKGKLDKAERRYAQLVAGIATDRIGSKHQ